MNLLRKSLSELDATPITSGKFAGFPAFTLLLLLAAATQILNSIGALTLVFAFRYGKAIVVAPLANAGAPLITAIISLLLLGVVPQPLKLTGLALALIAAVLLAIEPEESA